MLTSPKLMLPLQIALGTSTSVVDGVAFAGRSRSRAELSPGVAGAAELGAVFLPGVAGAAELGAVFLPGVAGAALSYRRA